MSLPDLETKSRRLFLGTCELLGLDPDHLTLAQKLRVSRVSALRLQIDDLEKAQLLGQPIDINKLVEASEALERLVGGNPEAATTHNFAGAKDELRRFFAQRAERIEARELKESVRLREENVRLREENTQLRTQLRSQPCPAPQPTNVVPIDGAARANAAKPPASYLKEGQPREPWETYGRGTVEVACWSPPEHRR